MPGWGLGHLTYGEKFLIRTERGPDPSAKTGTGGAPSPCRAFYMLTPGMIHGQLVTNSGHEFPALCASRRLAGSLR
jgi:hypothetical protein